MGAALLAMTSRTPGPVALKHLLIEVLHLQDTRHTKKLLTFFGLSSRLYSFHEHNEHEKESQVRSEPL